VALHRSGAKQQVGWLSTDWAVGGGPFEDCPAPASSARRLHALQTVLQVNIDGGANVGRHPIALQALAEEVLQLPNLVLRGPADDPGARRQF
jgi:hypothetical protein